MAAAALAALAALSLGCAEERAAINRVQANALDKTFFVGKLEDRKDDPEFFMRTTVVDVPFGANSDGLITSTDTQPTVRVRWDITEKLLVARLTYELVEGAEGAGAAADSGAGKGAKLTKDGQIVAAFAIEKHFDIRHDYNPSTGEEQNVLVENDTDRRFSQRQYFRVDFSQNLVTDAYELDTLSQLGISYGVSYSPVAYYVSDPAHPDAPVFDMKGGYFDVTTKALASPEVIEDEWWGDTPACFLLGYWPALNCNPSEITLRHSFLRVGERDYEPADWDGEKMDLVGVFTVDRQGYDRGYGIVDDKWRRFAARWDLFAKSHTEVACGTSATTPIGKEPTRDEDQNGTADECESVGRGSRCDEHQGLCTIPLRDRAVKTIPWHVNPGFDETLFDASAETLAAWSDSVRVAVLAGRLSECRRTLDADCEAAMGWPVPWSDDFNPEKGDASSAEVPEVFTLCHNPVIDGDAPECGEAKTAPRLGDLRYNFINILSEPEFLSPWGIMVDSEDPLSGEKIAGSVNLWGAVTDHYAAQLVDLLMLVNGTLDASAYISGENVSEWVAALERGGVAARAGEAMSKAELDRRMAAFDGSAIAPMLAGLPKPKPGTPPALKHKLRGHALVESGRLGAGNAALAERLGRLRGTAVEAAMIGPDMAQLAGADPTAPLSQEAIDRASPFARNNPAVRRAMARRGLVEQARRHSCRLEATEPDNLLGLVKKAEVLFGTPDVADKAAVQAWREEVYQWARVEYTKGVLAHELGHSMGLRHNFAASFDSLNYDPQYWQLRTENGAATADCEDGNLDGNGCVGPRWKDPITKAELDNDIARYSTTSVMDYPGETTQDQRLLGKYDRAAVRMVYGGVVDVWAKEGVSVTEGAAERGKAYKLTAFAASPGLTGVIYFPPTDPSQDYEFIHYSRYNSEFDLISSCGASSAPDAVLGATCEEQPLDVVDYRDMRGFVDVPEYAAFDWAVTPRAVDAKGRVRRGYMFSSDEYADAGNVPAFTGDSGADAYEIVRYLESQYELRYPLDAFRRNRVTFNSEDTTRRIQYKYFDKIQLIAKTFAFGALLDGDPENLDSGLLADGNYGPLALAGTVALDLFTRVLLRPEPGFFCPAESCYGVQPAGVEAELHTADLAPLPELYLYDFQVGLGDGRYLHNDYDYSQGYFWGDYQTQVGTYYDKVWSTYYLAEAFDYFISNSKADFVDGSYKNVSFATVYPNQVRRLYDALLTGDYDLYAPRVVPPKDPEDTPLVPLVFPAFGAKDGPEPPPAGSLMVEPNWGWNEQIWAMVWGSVFFPTNWSYKFIQGARIAALDEDPIWPAGEVVAFTDPETSVTYRAHDAGTEVLGGELRQRGTGARMLAWANKLLCYAYEVKRNGQGEAILDALGQPELVLDGDGAPVENPEYPGAVATLRKYVDNVDMMRQLVKDFAMPLGELPEP